VSEERPRVVWRTTRTDPPTEDDFLSHRARGLPRRGATIERWEGVSTFDDPAIAASMARRYGHGAYLARLTLSPDGPVRWAQTGGPSYYTLWGLPSEMLACVMEVVPLPTTVGEEEE